MQHSYGLEKHIAECKGRKECFLMGEFGAKCQYAIPIKGKRSVTSDITYKCKKYEYSYVLNKEVDSQLK